MISSIYKLSNFFKIFAKDLFNSEMKQKHSLPCFFTGTSVSLLIRFEIALAIGRISEPIEAYNILRLFLDVQIGYAIDMKEKSISFIKKISSKFFIMNFYRKVQKLELIKIFIFLFESQLIRINIIVIAFKFIITESA